jgi:hypothetical protein
MKTFALILIVLFLAAISTWAADAQGKDSRLFHVVSLKFKDTATPEQIKEVEVAFRALKDKIPGIVSLDWGTNVSPEKHDKGFTHCWVLSFKSDKDRDAYLVHPEHKKFGALLGPVLGDVMVIDFWSRQ